MDGISVLSQSVQASAYMFYVIHGSIIEDPPVVALGIASGIQSSILIAQYFYIKYYLGKEGKVIPGGEGEGEGGGGGGGGGGGRDELPALGGGRAGGHGLGGRKARGAG